MHNKKGFALFFTLGFIAIIFLISSSYIFLATNELAPTLKTGDSIKAFYLAEAGLARKLMEIETGNDNDINNPIVIDFPNGRSGTYTVDVNNEAAELLSEYTITSTGTYHGVHGDSVKRSEVQIRGRSAAHYASFTNSEELWHRGAKISNQGWYGTGTLAEGATHSNQHLHIYGRPIFDGPVTQSDIIPPNGYEVYPGIPTNPDFRQGFVCGVPQIALPSDDFIDSLKQAAHDDSLPPREGHYPENWRLNGDTTITFLANGTMEVINVDGYRDTVGHVENMPALKAIFVRNGNLKVSGVVKGQLTVGSDNDVTITSNLTYNSLIPGSSTTPPKIAPGSTDVLGIVAKNNVVLGSEAPFDVNINAYVMALDGSFYYDSARTPPVRGTVTHIGGVTTKYAGCGGTFSGSGLVSGYNTATYYDTRFDTQMNPPYFPILKNALNFSLFTKIYWREL